ncbi:MAG: peptidoglycan-associated lipoprotein Pal [Pseudomonadota bacterium]
MRNTTSIALIFAAGLVSACSTPATVSDTKAAAPAPLKAAVVEDQRAIHPVQAVSVDPLDDPRGALAKRSIYFDFDSYVLRNDGKNVVEIHAGYLGKNKNRKVLIQGNTDERGGTEYNLALGQKRAEAARKAMHALGVPDSQMEAVSLGEAKPKASGSGDAAWAENRRADIVY